jgi:hypothetical protein
MNVNHRQRLGHSILIRFGCARALRCADAREGSDSTGRSYRMLQVFRAVRDDLGRDSRDVNTSGFVVV